MNISSLFQRKPLTPHWSYTTFGVLWRLMFSDTGFILGEDRDTETKNVAFFCLNAENGDVLWKDMHYDESWWIGIEAILEDRVYLHGYTKPDMPEHGKITALDLGTGKMLWQNNKYAFLCATKKTVFAFRDMFERRMYYELDATTGEFIREMENPPENLYEMKKVCHGRSDFSYPEILNQTDEEYQLISRVIGEHYNINEMRGGIEYVRTAGKVIFNFHRMIEQSGSEKGEVLQNEFFVVDETNGKNIYSEALNASTPAPVPDSFFVDGNIAYYIKERKTLVALPVL